jgi:hypothetical protein
MQSKFVVNLIFVFVLVWGCVHTSVASEIMEGTPQLVVPEWYFNFGEVKEGTEYLHEFSIRNMGTGVLEIKTIEPG